MLYFLIKRLDVIGYILYKIGIRTKNTHFNQVMKETKNGKYRKIKYARRIFS